MATKLKNFITKLHNKTKRDHISRMLDEKVYCMKIAKKYGKDYWDGKRRYGYGGYSYIKDRWKSVAKKIINTYRLNNKSKILDLGCGKGFLLYEIKKILPDINIYGLDISSYAIKNSKTEIKKFLKIGDARKKLKFRKNFFDLLISFGVLHNFSLVELEKVFEEINRVSKKSYIMVESYKNDKELFNLQCWALTCQSFFTPEEWQYVFKKNNFQGDYEFIYF